MLGFAGGGVSVVSKLEDLIEPLDFRAAFFVKNRDLKISVHKSYLTSNIEVCYT